MSVLKILSLLKWIVQGVTILRIHQLTDTTNALTSSEIKP